MGRIIFPPPIYPLRKQIDTDNFWTIFLKLSIFFFFVGQFLLPLFRNGHFWEKPLDVEIYGFVYVQHHVKTSCFLVLRKIHPTKLHGSVASPSVLLITVISLRTTTGMFVGQQLLFIMTAERKNCTTCWAVFAFLQPSSKFQANCSGSTHLQCSLETEDTAISCHCLRSLKWAGS